MASHVGRIWLQSSGQHCWLVCRAYLCTWFAHVCTCSWCRCIPMWLESHSRPQNAAEILAHRRNNCRPWWWRSRPSATPWPSFAWKPSLLFFIILCYFYRCSMIYPCSMPLRSRPSKIHNMVEWGIGRSRGFCLAIKAAFVCLHGKFLHCIICIYARRPAKEVACYGASFRSTNSLGYVRALWQGRYHFHHFTGKWNTAILVCKREGSLIGIQLWVAGSGFFLFVR